MFYRPDALPVARPTVLEHWRDNITFHGLGHPKLERKSRPDAGGLALFLLRLVEEHQMQKQVDELQLASEINAEMDRRFPLPPMRSVPHERCSQTHTYIYFLTNWALRRRALPHYESTILSTSKVVFFWCVGATLIHHRRQRWTVCRGSDTPNYLCWGYWYVYPP